MAKISESEAISFSDWAENLAQLNLPLRQHDAFRREIVAFLRHCGRERAPVTVALARQYLETRRDPATRIALRWFVTRGRVAPERWPEDALEVRAAGTPEGKGVLSPTDPSRGVVAPPRQKFRDQVPPRAADDLGAPGWEAALIAESRRRGEGRTA